MEEIDRLPQSIDEVKMHQERIIRALYSLSGGPLPQKIIDAFQNVPRHLFVRRYRRSSLDPQWHEVTSDNLNDNLKDHLSELYGDHPLIIYGEPLDFLPNASNAFISTISQPSFVLQMIDLLNPRKAIKQTFKSSL